MHNLSANLTACFASIEANILKTNVGVKECHFKHATRVIRMFSGKLTHYHKYLLKGCCRHLLLSISNC